MKTIALASGKGGTGKTTITALFALFASGESSVVVVDADVEASNLPIALGAEHVLCQPFPGTSTAVIDTDVCTGCGLCVQACRFDAVGQQAQAGMYVVDPWSCEGCGHCAYVCPAGAIQLEGSRAGAACVADSRVGRMAFGQLEPGEDLSGRLVTEVRQLGVQQAAQADYLLIDGPPGTGCPVIASLANVDMLVAVAEPTVSGEHDLSRLLELASRFNLPVSVVLNKADLSAPGSERIRSLCEQRQLPLIAEVPFDPEIAGLLTSLADGSGEVDVSRPATSEVARAWLRLRAMLSE